MKMIILAAGKGTRLKPLTDDHPKCMVKYNDKPIIDHIIQVAKNCNVHYISIVGGYKSDVLEKYLENQGLTFFFNERFDSTNMVFTLFCAKKFMDDDLIISYADIIYRKEVLQKLISSKDDFTVVVDKKWRELWLKRMDEPLQDAETLKIKDGNIIEIGKKPLGYNDIEGQYIGLIKISKRILNKVINFYENLDRNITYDGSNFDNMYMTSFIQMVINHLLDVKPIFIGGGWIEIDNITDLSLTPIVWEENFK